MAGAASGVLTAGAVASAGSGPGRETTTGGGKGAAWHAKNTHPVAIAEERRDMVGL
jgi:hypothetical protein